jgi:hypothetical protein
MWLRGDDERAFQHATREERTMMKPADIMRQCEGLLAVWLGVAPAHEEEFNAWYKFEHMAELIGLDGFISARRYKADTLFPPYLALYETIDATAAASPAFAKMLANPTPWSARMRTYYGENRIRNTYTRIAFAARDGHPYGATLLLVQSNAVPGGQKAVEDWFKANAEAALAAPGVTAARVWRAVSGTREYLEHYEFEFPGALRTPQWSKYFMERRSGVAKDLTDTIEQKHEALGMELTR